MSTVPYAHLSRGPAYIQPIATPPVAPRRNGVNPLIPLCCLGVILFLIASTIILALIPVYLKSRGERATFQAAQFSALYRINNGTLPLGALQGGNCLVIQQDQRNFIAGNNRIAPSTVSVVSCSTIGNTTVPSRRRRQSRGPEGNLISLSGFLFAGGNCLRGACLAQRGEVFRAALLGRGTFFLSLAGANGTRYVFSITVISVTIFPPQVISGSTSTAVQAAARANDIAILNFALILERLEAFFYASFQGRFTRDNFTAAGFPNETFDYFGLIASHEATHAAALESIIRQLGGTPVGQCTYNFSLVVDVISYVVVARLLENTGASAYTGAANGIADPLLRQIAATVATVEARHAAYLNILNNTNPFPNAFEPAVLPVDIIAAIAPFISCPFQLVPPVVPYVGSSSFTGTVPTSNDTTVVAYTSAMYQNDLRVLNYALVSEQLESFYYNTYASNFSFAAFADSELSAALIATYFSLIRSHEETHVIFLRQVITGRGGTPVPPCTYNFNIPDVATFVQVSRLLENTGVKAYDGAINTITDPVIIQGAASVALVEARHASFLNLITDNVPFPNATDPTATPAEIVAALAAFQTCPFTLELPVVLTPSTVQITL